MNLNWFRDSKYELISAVKATLYGAISFISPFKYNTSY